MKTKFFGLSKTETKKIVEKSLDAAIAQQRQMTYKHFKKVYQEELATEIHGILGYAGFIKGLDCDEDGQELSSTSMSWECFKDSLFN